MKTGEIFTIKESFFPLYRKGDKFKIIKINNNPDLMPVEAVDLRSRVVYGFTEEEII